MRIGFVTCVKLGLSCMEEIYKIGGKIDIAITLKDEIARNKSGRIYLDDFCALHGITLIKIRNINDDESIKVIKESHLDWLFIIGWSQIAGPNVLEAPKYGCLGMHPTLLPKGRGRAPIPWAILKGLDKTGVTLFKLTEKVDAGPIIAQEIITIDPRETATSLYKKVEEAHRLLIDKLWKDLEQNNIIYINQKEEDATYWPERKPEDGKLTFDFASDEVDRLVRALTHPYPGAFLELENRKYIIWDGYPHKGYYLDKSFFIDQNGNFWLSTRDGSFEATKWEIVLIDRK